MQQVEEKHGDYIQCELITHPKKECVDVTIAILGLSLGFLASEMMCFCKVYQ